MTGPAAIEATDIHKAFGSTVAVETAAVVVEPGQLVALLGPSGSGKTTLLRVIAGLEVPDRGTVTINGRVVAGPGVWVEPERRRVGMVFQDGALFPHLSVEANVGFGDPEAGRVQECLELVGLADRAKAFPHELSGGERQRIALARALAPEPDVVLLDEPFAALDATLRATLREDVARILAEAGASALMVTHDQQEALSLADLVVVMRDGLVEQAGSPEQLYAAPATTWIAGFLGAAEVLEGTAHGAVVDCELGHLATVSAMTGPVEVVVRPEAIRILTEGTVAAAGSVPATVLGRAFFGHDQLVRLALPSGRQVQSRTTGGPGWQPGQVVQVTVDGPVSVLPHQRSA